jgi:hemerythrin-like domain-containing protein
MNPIKDLKDEHQAVKLTLRILEKISHKIECIGKITNTDHIEQLIEFFSVFVDKCHHSKEEDLLFPAMSQIGVSKDDGPIGVLLHEHQLGRTYVKGMRDALSAYKKGNNEASNAFLKNAKGYMTLLIEHIYKEDNVLFPLAEKNLPKQKQAELWAGFEKIEVEKIGIGKHDEFHRLLEDLQKTYLHDDGVGLEASAPACPPA